MLTRTGASGGARTTYSVARNGYLECLRYAHENGCEFDFDTIFVAAQNGHLECLQYARDSPWVRCE